MKTPSQDLFELIKALSKSEKSYFKSAAKKNNELKIYYNLFVTIDNQKNYNEIALIKQLGYTKKKQAFAVLKNYLYKELLTTIIKNTEIEHKGADSMQQMQQINFLAKKGLFNQFTKLWNKCYADAKIKELFQVQFLLREQLHNLKINFFLKTSQEELKELIDEDELFHKEYEDLLKIKNLYRTIQIYNNQSQIRLLDNELADLKTILLHPALQKLPKKYSFHYFYYFHFCLALVQYLTHDYDKALYNLEKIKEGILKNEALIIANPHLNIDFVSSYYIVTFLLQRYTDFFNYLEKGFLKKIDSLQHKAFIYIYWTNSTIRYLISTGLYAQAEEHITNTNKQVELYINEVPIEIKQRLLTSLCIANFILGNYNEAFYRNKSCIQTFAIYPKQDMQRTIYCLSIIIAFELKNKRLLQNECEAAYQFFYRKKMQSEFEMLLISFFRKIAKSNFGRLDLKERFTNFRQQLEPIKKDPVMGQVFRYFNFYGWVQSKEQSINYMEFVIASKKGTS